MKQSETICNNHNQSPQLEVEMLPIDGTPLAKLDPTLEELEELDPTWDDTDPSISIAYGPQLRRVMFGNESPMFDIEHDCSLRHLLHILFQHPGD